MGFTDSIFIPVLRRVKYQIRQQTCKKVCKKLSVLWIASAAIGPRTPPRTCNTNCAERRRRANSGLQRRADAHIRVSGDSEERAGKSRVIQISSVREVEAFHCLCSPEDEFGEAGVRRAARRAVNPGDHPKGARAASSLYREKKILSTGSPV